MRSSLLLFASGLVAAAGPALAHHSIAAIYDRERTVEVQGVLSKIELQNPHSNFELTVREPDGRASVWILESRGVQGMVRIGFDKSAVQLGERVTVRGSPAREGPRQLWLNSLDTAAGKHFDFSFRGQGGFGAP